VKNRHFRQLLALGLASLLLAGCAATEITSSWQDTTFEGPIHKVLVLGVAERSTNRKAFESAFANQLQNWGIQAVPGFAVLSGPEASQKEIRAKGAELGVDAILVTKWINLRKSKEQVTDVDYDRGFGPAGYPYYVRRYPGYYHPYYHDWYYDYSRSFARVRSYEIEYKILDLETNLYAFKSGKLIWTATSRTTTAESPQGKAASIVQVLVKRLKADGLI